MASYSVPDSAQKLEVLTEHTLHQNHDTQLSGVYIDVSCDVSTAHICHAM